MLKGFVSGEEKDIKRIPMKGKNLFSTTWEQGSINGTTGANEGSGTIVRTAGYIPIKTNQTYSIKRDISNGYINVRFYDTNKGYIGSGSNSTIRLISGTTTGNPMGNNLSFCCFDIIADGAAFIRFNDSSNNTDTHFMMVEGEYTAQSMPAFEPYGYQEGWEVRDNQDRLIWGREDELQTTTGTLPFKGYSLPVKVKSLLGNAVQNGTPAPDNIIIPEMCGVRTGNLYDRIATDANNGYENGTYLLSSGSTRSSAQYFISEYIAVKPETSYTLVYNSDRLNAPSVCFYDNSKQYINGESYSLKLPFSFITPTGTAYIRLSGRLDFKSAIMLNEGTTAEDYEPYGWAEKITNAGQTVSIYLGEVPTVRRIKKLVLTGIEIGINKRISPENSHSISIDRNSWPATMTGYGISSHFVRNGTVANLINGEFYVGSTAFSFRLDNCADAAAFKSYLAAQYDAGTPVTIWYVLAEPQTAIVNEPLAKIGDYADELNSTVATLPEIPTTTGQNTLTVDTTLKPSNLTIKGHIKELT